MNPSTAVLATAFLVTLVLRPSWALAASALSVDDQMKQLADQSQAFRPACERFRKDGEALLGKESVDKPWNWDAKAERLLKLAEAYPGTPQASQAGQKLLRTTPKPGNRFKIAHVSGLYACDSMAYLKVCRKLISSLAKFDKARQIETEKTLLARAKSELAGPGGMLSVFIQGAIIERLYSTRLFPELTALGGEIEKALKNSAELKKKAGDEATHATQATYVQTWAHEGALAKSAADSWLAILQKADRKK